MKFWKVLFIGILSLGLAGFSACSKGGKYADAKDLMSKSVKAMEKFVTDMDKAGDSKAVVAAINAFAGKMEDLKPKFQALNEKYPELKDETRTPEELKSQVKLMEEMSGKMINAMMKLYQYSQDPDVQKAQESLNKIMMEDQ